MSILEQIKSAFNDFETIFQEKGGIDSDFKKNIEDMNKSILDRIENEFSQLEATLDLTQKLQLLKIKGEMVEFVNSMFENYIESKS